MNILAIIPARSGSKGVKDKNIAQLGDTPLLTWIYRAARQVRGLDCLILSTDSPSYAALAEKAGIEVPFLRPAEFSGSSAPLVDVCKHALRHFDQQGTRYDLVMSLQPTCPFLSAQTIDNALRLQEESGCDSVTTVAEIETAHPYIAKKLMEGGRIQAFCPAPEGEPTAPRQRRAKAYYLTGGLYLRKRELIEAAGGAGHFLGSDPRAVTVDRYEAVDINNDLDLEFAQYLVSSGRIAQ